MASSTNKEQTALEGEQIHQAEHSSSQTSQPYVQSATLFSSGQIVRAHPPLVDLIAQAVMDRQDEEAVEKALLDQVLQRIMVLRQEEAQWTQDDHAQTTRTIPSLNSTTLHPNETPSTL